VNLTEFYRLTINSFAHPYRTFVGGIDLDILYRESNEYLMQLVIVIIDKVLYLHIGLMDDRTKRRVYDAKLRARSGMFGGLRSIRPTSPPQTRSFRPRFWDVPPLVLGRSAPTPHIQCRRQGWASRCTFPVPRLCPGCPGS